MAIMSFNLFITSVERLLYSASKRRGRIMLLYKTTTKAKTPTISTIEIMFLDFISLKYNLSITIIAISLQIYNILSNKK